MSKQYYTYDGTSWTVRIRPAYAVIGAVGFVFCALFCVLCLNSSDEGGAVAALCVFGSFGLLSTGLMLACFLERISYDLYGFTYRNMLGISRRYDWADVEGISDSKSNVTVYVGGRRIQVGEDHVGVHEFLNTLNKRYNSIHGVDVPIDPRSKKDIFNGHVDDPRGFVTVFIMLLVVFAALDAFVLSTMKYPTQEELTYVRFIADSYWFDDSSLYIESCDMENPVRVRAWEDVTGNPDKFMEKLENREEFIARCIYSRGGKKPNEEVWELTGSDGTVYISYSDNLLFWQKNDINVKLLLLGMDIFILGFIACFVIVGRNPDKFKPWVVRFFYKEGYIH